MELLKIMILEQIILLDIYSIENAELPIKIWDNLNSKYVVGNIFTKTTLAGILKDNGKLILSRGDLKKTELKNNENIYSNINLITGGIILNQN